MAELEPAPPPKLTLRSHRDGDVITLMFEGELDISTIEDVRPQVIALLDANPNHVVVDMPTVRFMDSSGLALLLEIRKQVSSIELRRPTDVIRQVIERTGLASALPVTQ
jgi:anti-anti-sigma factor